MSFISRFIADFTEFAFWRHALLGGLCLAVLCSWLSVYVVLKRMAFIGQGISHSAFGGLALGVLLFGGGRESLWWVYGTALIFCLIVGAFIGATSRRVSEDSAIGVFFVVSMALGVIFFSQAKGFNADPASYMFGSIVAMSMAEAVALAALALVGCASLFWWRRQLLYFTFDEEMAQASGVRVNYVRHALIALLSLTIVASAPLIGIVLISALLILPGATAQLIAGRFGQMVALAIACGVASLAAGIIISWASDWPTGATIVVVQFALFLAALGYRKLASA